MRNPQPRRVIGAPFQTTSGEAYRYAFLILALILGVSIQGKVPTNGARVLFFPVIRVGIRTTWYRREDLSRQGPNTYLQWLLG